MKNKNIIMIEEGDLDELVNQVSRRLIAQHTAPVERWIDTDEAMKKLRIKSKTTLQKYRDEGRIRFHQKDKKTILYDQFSINKYLENNAHDTF
ncbi:MAG: helix-turn-helix domain-containing protein [Reichenbachiella sp.]|uniref:helix-turn-helix domain-containing protein n=1 Tax=Reichenbachiella sp. TaxID=2184521 RepID=UPI003265981B